MRIVKLKAKIINHCKEWKLAYFFSFIRSNKGISHSLLSSINRATVKEQQSGASASSFYILLVGVFLRHGAITAPAAQQSAPQSMRGRCCCASWAILCLYLLGLSCRWGTSGAVRTWAFIHSKIFAWPWGATEPPPLLLGLTSPVLCSWDMVTASLKR